MICSSTIKNRSAAAGVLPAADRRIIYDSQ